MIRPFRAVTYVLAGLLALSAPLARGAERLTSQADLDRAIAKTLGQEDAARSTITTLLRRDDVRQLAGAYGLDLRRAQASVATLQGEDLQNVSRLAANADLQLSGGDTAISISLVALLLIVIIIILVAR